MYCAVPQVAVFAAASDDFSIANINCSVSESLERFEPLLKMAVSMKLPVRGYVSCALGCPYKGQVSPADVVKVSAVNALALEEAGWVHQDTRTWASEILGSYTPYFIIWRACE